MDRDDAWPTNPTEVLALARELRDEVAALRERLRVAELESSRFQQIIARLKRMQFGRTSERHAGQLVLDLVAEVGGEDAFEVLDFVPGYFRVIRHVRPRFACRRCVTVIQAPAPSLPIERGLPGPGLLAQVLVSKYLDHTPLSRQARIYARAGIDIDRGTTVGWVGKSARLLPAVAGLLPWTWAARQGEAREAA